MKPVDEPVSFCFCKVNWLHGFVGIPKGWNEQKEDGEQFQPANQHNQTHETFEDGVGKHIEVAIYQLTKSETGVGKQCRRRTEGGFKVQIL